MNRKGFFYSLSAVLLVIVLSMLLRFDVDESKMKDDVTAQEIKLETVNEYVRDFRVYYLDNLLAVSSKYALSAISSYVDTNGPLPDVRAAVEGLVTTGSYGAIVISPDVTVPALTNTSQSALTVKVATNVLDISLNEITQPNPWTIRLAYTVTFEFGGLDSKWSDKLDKEVFVTVYGFQDPQYKRRINEMFWKASPSVPCFLQRLGGGCSVDGICPLLMCI